MTALRIGLVGAGNIASHHLPAYREHPDELELVAVCDLNEQLAHQRAHEAGLDEIYTDAGQMIRDSADRRRRRRAPCPISIRTLRSRRLRPGSMS